MSRKFLNGIDMVKTQAINFVLQIIAGDHASPVEGIIWWDTTAQRVGVRGTSTTHKLVRDGGDLTAGSVANTALTTNPLSRTNHTGTQLAATVSDFDTQVRTSRLDQMAVPTADLNLNSRKITSLANGVSAQDATTLTQVQTLINDAVTGLDWKQAVRVATTANGTLATAFANGQTVDGVTLVTGDRILLKSQSTGSENGIYTVNASGAPTRATDADTSAEIKDAAVLVAEGTTLGSTQWHLSTDNITLGTTALVWVQQGTGGTSYTGGNGLTLTGVDFNVGAGTGITVDATNVNIDTAVVTRKFTQAIGNGSLTSIAVTHSLGTKDIIASVRTASDDTIVECDVVATSTSVATFIFAVAPTTNQYNVVVMG